jgi:hypothetical protein
MRLRLAPVEYKVCTTERCGNEYEGAQCSQCRQPFDPKRMRKELHDRLILVDVDPPIYEHIQRYRCPECKNLYDLRESDVVASAQCVQCKKPLFARDRLQKIWQDAATLLHRARKLDRARRQLRGCPHCTHPVPVICWCPLSRSCSHPDAANGLPQNPIVAWVRTFHLAESLEELQVREWRETVGEEAEGLAEEAGMETEMETKTENESVEMSQHGEESDP